jgi:hypothetical protein
LIVVIIAYFHPSVVAAILFTLPFNPVAGSGHAALPPLPPPAAKDASSPQAAGAPPIVASSQSSPPLPSLCSQSVVVVTSNADASKRGLSSSCMDVAPMSHVGLAPAASYKAEAESKASPRHGVVSLTGRLRVGSVEPTQLSPVGSAALPDSQSHWSRALLPSQVERLPQSSSLELPDGGWFGLGAVF